MMIRGQNAKGEIVEHEVIPLPSEEIARRQAIRDAKRAPVVDPRDALLDLIAGKLLEAGTLQAEEVTATGAKVSGVVASPVKSVA